MVQTKTTIHTRKCHDKTSGEPNYYNFFFVRFDGPSFDWIHKTVTPIIAKKILKCTTQSHTVSDYPLRYAIVVCFWRDSPQCATASSFMRFSRSHITAHQSVGLLWTSDQIVAETSTRQHSRETDIHAPGGIRTHNLSRRAAADLRLRRRAHWDRHATLYNHLK